MDYHHKYKKYKSKYLNLRKTQIGARYEDDDKDTKLEKAHELKLQQLFDQLNSSEILDEYLFINLANNFLELINDYAGPYFNNEEIHMFEDYLSKRFIEHIANRKITNLDTIQNIAKIINKINNVKYTRWYA